MFSLDKVTADQGSVLDVAALVALVGWTLVEALILALIRAPVATRDRDGLTLGRTSDASGAKGLRSRRVIRRPICLAHLAGVASIG